MVTERGQYVCYVLVSSNGKKTYAGCTNNLKRRLRQHRGLIRGGAKATASFGPATRILFVVSGFKDRTQALRFEWRLKQHRGWYQHLRGSPVSKRRVLFHHALRWTEEHFPTGSDLFVSQQNCANHPLCYCPQSPCETLSL